MAQFSKGSASAHPDGAEFTLPFGHRIGDVPFFFGIVRAFHPLDAGLNDPHRRRKQVLEDLAGFHQKREDPPAPEKLPPPE